MENMMYRPGMDDAVLLTVEAVRDNDWRLALPVLNGKQVVLREPRLSDAASLFAMLTTEEVARFISPPPSTVEGFEQFIEWTLRQRRAGGYACFVVTLRGFDTAIGLFQVRQLDAEFQIAEWGFAIGSPFWGTGVFQESAHLVLGFAFDRLGIQRLEARASVENGRGNAALRKTGAVREGILRGALIRNGRSHDQVLYAILAGDWRATAPTPVPLSLPRYVH